MEIETSYIELIKKRQSKRKFLNKDLDADQIKKINTIIQNYTTGPFGNKVEFQLIEKKIAKENHKVKLGTYGFISGARYFIVGQVKNRAYANEDYGFLLENIILQLTAMDLGTCWLGGTFSRADISEILSTDSEMIIPAITPVGIPTDSYSIKESIIRWGAKSDSRKEWGEIFFADSFNKSLLSKDAGIYNEALEMLRLAPSASNKQPWRILKSEDAFHFYLKRTQGYNKMGKGTDLQKLDMGIAMSHFELACKELKLQGEWTNMNPEITSSEIDEYCVTWKI
jgi:nitroreductase